MTIKFNIDKTEQLYLLVDGAGTPNLLNKAYQKFEHLRQEPLFITPPFNNLIHVSPRIIVATEKVQEWFLRENQHHRGYFFSSNEEIKKVATYVRKLNLVETPTGNEAILRIVDTNIAHVLLDENNRLLWSIFNKAWLFYDDKWNELVKPEHLKPFKNNRLNLTNSEWDRISLINWNNVFPKKIASHLKQWFPNSYTHNHKLSDWIKTQMNIAYSKGLRTEQDIIYYFNIISYLGVETLDNNNYPNITSLLNNSSKDNISVRVAKAAHRAEKIALQFKD